MKIWNLGYPRIGKKRELKRALESYWAGESSSADLETAGRTLCLARWNRQKELGVNSIPVNDFSFYDHMLDMSLILGIIPERFKKVPQSHWFDLYFAMARGHKDGAHDVAALDMTKWFNTNYHYMVPEISAGMEITPRWEKLFYELDPCSTLAETFHPVLVGPYTFVKLSKLSGLTTQEALAIVQPRYQEILKELEKRKFPWVQFDEPALCMDPQRDEMRGIKKVYESFEGLGPSILLATYFESADPWLSEIAMLPVQGMHFDLFHGVEGLKWLKTKAFPKNKVMSLGLVNGRNVWAAPLTPLVKSVQEICNLYPFSDIWLAPSCSLMHLPHDKSGEKKWDKDFLSWVSFADQRLEELTYIKRAIDGDKTVDSILEERSQILTKKAISTRIHRSDVKQAVERIDVSMKSRKTPFAKRVKAQQKALALPLLPTTTIGSFPQTTEIRSARRDMRSGASNASEYHDFLRKEIERVIRFQEKLGLDVLVHGEPERADMVEYFGELLEGFVFSDSGWVQSYGSRCVKPPFIYGDVKRKTAMTVAWFKYAQELTERPVKGMLTGPVTILNWSFVREDQAKEKTAFQIALAIREEVKELEASGAKVIQIDEAALREGLPIKRMHWNKYLQWSIDSFKICSSGVKDETQIQTHMCYSEFHDIMDSINRMDADVLLIEHSRSGKEFLECFKKNRYDNHIGPGVYDIHSPRVPDANEIEKQIRELLVIFGPERLWINPDCGLKTRKVEQVEPALTNMVEAAQKIRDELLTKQEAEPSFFS